MAKNDLTDDDRAKLQEYLDNADKLAAQEPEMYKNTLTDTEPCTEWNEWNDKAAELNAEYRDVIIKALSIWFSDYDLSEAPQAPTQIVKALLKDNANAQAAKDASKALLAAPYTFMYNSVIFNSLYSLSLADFNTDELTGIATYTGDGFKIEISDYKELKNITPSELKLWDAALIFLTYENYSGGTDPQTVVEIPLKEYAETRGRSITPRETNTTTERQKEKVNASKRKARFKKDIKADLDALQKIKFTIAITKGPVTGNFKEMPLILNNPEISGATGNEVIKIQFDDRLAAFLLGNNQEMRYNMKLQAVNGSNPDAFRVGRYMNLHASMYNNAKSGTRLTLSVKSLLSAAPSIPSYEKLETWKQERNWRNVIKKPLEDVLNALLKSKVLKQWIYRDAKTGEKLTTATAADISWNKFYNLRVDFSFMDDMQSTQTLERLLTTENTKGKNMST